MTDPYLEAVYQEGRIAAKYGNSLSDCTSFHINSDPPSAIASWKEG